jgi:hypothetical protein
MSFILAEHCRSLNIRSALLDWRISKELTQYGGIASAKWPSRAIVDLTISSESSTYRINSVQNSAASKMVWKGLPGSIALVDDLAPTVALRAAAL